MLDKYKRSRNPHPYSFGEWVDHSDIAFAGIDGIALHPGAHATCLHHLVEAIGTPQNLNQLLGEARIEYTLTAEW